MMLNILITGPRKSPDPKVCPGSEKGVKYQGSCYYLIEEKKSWMDAEEHCKDNFDGHLVTVLDFTFDVFLNYMLSDFNEEMWIGIKLKEKREQKWTSGWHVAYDVWNGYPGDFKDGTCVTRSKSWQWSISPCTNKYSFVCEKSSMISPVLKPVPVGAQCPEKPEDWLDLDGEYCYFIDTTNLYTWYRANLECQRRGGLLVKIHSKEENDILQRFVIYKRWSVAIGFYRLSYENVFVWTDRSRMDWTNFDVGEPNRDDEQCGEMWTRSSKWHNIKCEWERGYICSVKKVSSLHNGTEFINVNSSECSSNNLTSMLMILSIAMFLLVVILSIVICCLRICYRRKQKSKFDNFQPPVPSAPRPRYSSNTFVLTEDCQYEDMH